MISKNKFFESSIPLLTCPKRVSRGLFFDITSQTEQGVNLPIKNKLLKLCKQLQEKLTVNTKSEIDGALLCDELISVQFFIKDKLSNVENEINTKEMTPLFVLNFIKKHCLRELYSNTWIVLRILLTIPVTVASGERSFSKTEVNQNIFKKYHVARST